MILIKNPNTRVIFSTGIQFSGGKILCTCQKIGSRKVGQHLAPVKSRLIIHRFTFLLLLIACRHTSSDSEILTFS